MISKKLLVVILLATSILLVGMLSMPVLSTEEGEHTETGGHTETGEHTEEGGHGEEEGYEHVHAKVPDEYANYTNPYAGNESAIEAGKKIYETACIMCHGKKGDGNGIAAKALKVRPADFTDKEMVSRMSDSFWFWRVSEGIEGSGMPAWKNVLNETQRWLVINYAMNFSKGPAAKKSEEKPFYLLTEKAARKKGAHIIGLVANLSVLLVAGLIFVMFKR